VTPERLRQVEALYNDTLALPPNQRTVFLDRSCGNDRDLRSEIESLLACENAADTYLEKPAIHFAAESLASEGAGLLVGRMLGRYQLLSMVGRGGMGDVYCAVDSRLNRLVAVKVLPPYLANLPELAQRFEQEARSIAALNHPHICILHDADHDGDTYYLVFEYLVGEVLADRLCREALPLPEAVEYAIQIAEALEHAHQQGIVHRDLKPRNVMLTKAGAKLLDFGIAELRYPGSSPSESPQKERMTSGPTSGTLAYMAPEQVEGRETDARTDIFAFGVTTYEMITGHAAFRGDVHGQQGFVVSIFKDASPAILQANPLVAPALDRLIGRCLAKHASERWQSTSDVLQMLKQIKQLNV
jgi:eukaryotic-like serine/threonine-protein kinase